MKFCYVMKEEDASPMTAVAQLHGGIGAYDNLYEEIQANYNDIFEKGFFAERTYMEQNSEFKQIIPCFVLRDFDKNKTIIYQRKPTHTESRLAGLYTCAFGGHIDPGDYPSIEDIFDNVSMTDGMVLPAIVRNALGREMKEETEIDFKVENLFFEGFLYDPSNDVGTVHLGLIYTYYTEITEELVQQITELPEIYKVMVVNNEAIPDLMQTPNIKLESWAQIILKNYTEQA